jgi:hypothetical protein
MIKKIFSIVLLAFMLLNFVSVSAQSTSTSSWYNTPILDESLEFKAELENGIVYTKWTAYNKSDKFKYYKVIRSNKYEDPVYPDNGYVKAISNVVETEYKDTNPLYWLAYYRVCAITYENNRFCSNVVKINNISTSSTDSNNITVCTMEYAPVCWYTNGNYKTYSNKCMLLADKSYYKYSGVCKATTQISSSNLSSYLQNKSRNLINTFVGKLEKWNYSNDKKIELIDTVTWKLVDLKEEKSSLTNLIDFLVKLLKEKRLKYENDFSEIEDIFNIN